jgi:Mg2+ and Co2+ transporter CorA
VLDNIVVSMQLPDPEPCTIVPPREGEQTPRLARSPALTVRTRYLPAAMDLGGADIAIGLLTNAVEFCAALGGRLRGAMDEVEEGFYGAMDEVEDAFHRKHDKVDPARLTEYFQRLQLLGQAVEEVERDIRQLLRRLPPERGTEEPLVRRLLASYYRTELDQLGSLQTDIRMAGETMASVLSAQQLQAAQTEQQRSQRFQRAATLVASAILVPALVASLYGANVQLPGRETWWALGGLVALMVCGGLVTWWYMETRDAPRQRRHHAVAATAIAMGLLAAGLLVRGQSAMSADPTPAPPAAREAAAGP